MMHLTRSITALLWILPAGSALAASASTKCKDGTTITVSVGQGQCKAVKNEYAQCVGGTNPDDSAKATCGDKSCSSSGTGSCKVERVADPRPPSKGKLSSGELKVQGVKQTDSKTQLTKPGLLEGVSSPGTTAPASTGGPRPAAPSAPSGPMLR